MALHHAPVAMLKESLPELQEAARFCVFFRKTEKEKWGDFTGEGILGYPGAILLFSIIDTIGGYFAGNSFLRIPVDGKQEIINGGNGKHWKHFLILNSPYFGLTLSKEQINKLYGKFRSLLTHNAVLGKYCYLIPHNEYGGVIFEGTYSDKPMLIVSLKELFEVCSTAVALFLGNIEGIEPNKKMKKFI